MNSKCVQSVNKIMFKCCSLKFHFFFLLSLFLWGLNMLRVFLSLYIWRALSYVFNPVWFTSVLVASILTFIRVFSQCKRTCSSPLAFNLNCDLSLASLFFFLMDCYYETIRLYDCIVWSHSVKWVLWDTYFSSPADLCWLKELGCETVFVYCQ